MKFILNNPTPEQLEELNKLDIYVYKSEDGVHYVDLTNISVDDLYEGPVDLGLSVKWASCNVGASKPCDPGLLFQFGHIDGYEYGDETHKFVNDYSSSSDKKYTSNKILDLADDAAYVWSMGEYRMPTKDELYELVNNTTNTWCTCTELDEHHEGHTVLGRLFVSKVDKSKKIFIPAVGYFNGINESFTSSGTMGCLWSSQTCSAEENCGYLLKFYSYSIEIDDKSLKHGMPVRGVKQ